MEKSTSNEETVSNEILSLGKNLLGIVKAAWDHPERKRVQTEIEHGLVDLGETIKQEASSFSQGSAGQRLIAELESLEQKVHNPVTRDKFRQDILKVLQSANQELENVIRNWEETEQ